MSRQLGVDGATKSGQTAEEASHSLDLVDLEQYVLRAEVNMIERPGKQFARKQAFSRGPNGATPYLRKDQSNRIIIYAGCFNPPHRGHRELLTHAFLYTDSKTVAAMIVPLDDDRLVKKQHVNEPLVLTKKQRTQLWHDDFLRRWSWVFPGSHREVEGYIDRVIALAAKDGFHVNFVSLGGSDHVTITGGTHLWSWGSGSAMTSDITRPASFVFNEDGRPCSISGCKPWRKILPARGTNTSFPNRDCGICWPCIKLKWMYPEFTGIGLVSRDGNPLFNGDGAKILNRCHSAKGLVWSGHRKRVGGILLYFPSGRKYPVDDDPDKELDSVSSTKIRKSIVEAKRPAAISTETQEESKCERSASCSAIPATGITRPLSLDMNCSPRAGSATTRNASAPPVLGSSSEVPLVRDDDEDDKLHKKLKAMALNARLLMSFLGLHDYWPFARPVEPPECFPCDNWELWKWECTASTIVDFVGECESSDSLPATSTYNTCDENARTEREWSTEAQVGEADWMNDWRDEEKTEQKDCDKDENVMDLEDGHEEMDWEQAHQIEHVHD